MLIKRFYQKLKSKSFIMATNYNSSIQTQASKLMKQKYDYFLVLDFEATCDDKKKLVPQVSSSLFYILFFCFDCLLSILSFSNLRDFE
jgi:hypothetical protein